ncbi:MAG: hypothetical protein H0X46_03195 [Bacteroidetes bacterium]|nr:hypothetical protein [Bacteroidota bacterium]
MDTYRNGLHNGPHKAFYKNGKLWYEDTRVDNKIEGKSIEYTPDGHIAEITEWKNSSTVSILVFYQSNPWSRQKYFFVSKSGFYIQKGKQGIKFDKTTPDSIIEDYGTNKYIWLKGEKKIFLNTEPIKISPSHSISTLPNSVANKQLLFM